MAWRNGGVLDHREFLRRVSLRDEALVQSMLADQAENESLDPRTRGLVHVAALLAVGGTEPSYRRAVDIARVGGATEDEIVGVLVAVAPTVGGARTVAEAPKLALALGYDVDVALDPGSAS